MSRPSVSIEAERPALTGYLGRAKIGKCVFVA